MNDKIQTSTFVYLSSNYFMKHLENNIILEKQTRDNTHTLPCQSDTYDIFEFKKNINTIIWDWNGTLLNDIEISISAINTLLSQRNLQTLTTESYRRIFGFPIIDYYQRLGFDFTKEPFSVPAQEYIDLYTSSIPQSELHKNATSILSFFNEIELTQVILSASEINILEESIKLFQIEEYFEHLAGLDNHYAQSKVELGKAMLEKMQIKPDEACLIGDTTHDAEVASHLGCRCILVANGHQSYELLHQTGNKVIQQLSELKDIF